MAFELVRTSYKGPTPVASVEALRAVASASFADDVAVMIVNESVIVRWSPSSFGDDAAAGIIKPNDKTDLQPGRWVYSGTIPTAVNQLVRVILLEGDNGGAVWSSSEFQLVAGEIVVPQTVVLGSTILYTTITGRFTSTGTRQAEARFNAGAFTVEEIALQAAANDQTTINMKMKITGLTPGTYPVEILAQAGAGFIGSVQILGWLYSVSVNV